MKGRKEVLFERFRKDWNRTKRLLIAVADVRDGILRDRSLDPSAIEPHVNAISAALIAALPDWGKIENLPRDTYLFAAASGEDGDIGQVMDWLERFPRIHREW